MNWLKLYFILLNFMASFVVFVIAHELVHYISFQPYTKAICLDFDGGTTIARTESNIPASSYPVLGPMMVENEKWAMRVAFVFQSVFYIVNHLAFTKRLEKKEDDTIHNI